MKTLRLPLFILLLSSCASAENPEDPVVVATTGMIGDAASAIAGDAALVETLMGPGVDPHLYRATASDVARLGNARLILYNGLHLEGKLSEVLESLGDRTVAVAEALPQNLLISSEGVADPHVWFDASLWVLVVDRIHEALSDAFPEAREGLARRHAAYRDEVLAVHAEALESMSSLPPANRVLVTAHDAFSYFGQAYGVEVIGLQGLSTVDEPSTRDVQELSDLIASRRLPAVFVESSVSPRAMEAVREATRAQGWEVRLGGELFSDALGSQGSPEGTWAGMFRHNLQVLREGLGGAP